MFSGLALALDIAMTKIGQKNGAELRTYCFSIVLAGCRCLSPVFPRSSRTRHTRDI